MTLPSVHSPFEAYSARDLVARFEACDGSTLVRGRRWYAAARAECRSMAAEFDRPLSQVAAVLAITSPDAQLVSNLRWTREILAGERSAGKYPGDQAPKVAAALTSSRPGQYASGPKVSAFYRAIMGDSDALVLDRWALFAAGGEREKGPGVRARRVFDSAYRSAAAACGETVREFQAIVWIQTRESTVKSNGQAVRLADIV